MIINNENFQIYSDIRNDSLLNDFIMIGGTALSLHINHRDSLDIDLVCITDQLPTYKIEQLINKLKQNYNVHQIHDARFINSMKIYSLHLFSASQIYLKSLNN